ncbi:MAG TPA: hypothetical protein VMD08_00710 [Candidatus Baltobacteraceae bacterium]|nr:hypothetical protein [Candidatus Baltobacteraceae bacterium]
MDIHRNNQGSLVLLCPRAHPFDRPWAASVKAYCMGPQGRVCAMIPSIDEFVRFCTSPNFAECPWFVESPPPAQHPADMWVRPRH